MCGYVLRIYVCLIRRWNVGPRPNIDVSSYVLNLQGITPEHVRPSSPYRAQMFVSLRVRAAERICLPVISMSTERARIHGDREGERERETTYRWFTLLPHPVCRAHRAPGLELMRTPIIIRLLFRFDGRTGAVFSLLFHSYFSMRSPYFRCNFALPRGNNVTSFERHLSATNPT